MGNFGKLVGASMLGAWLGSVSVGIIDWSSSASDVDSDQIESKSGPPSDAIATSTAKPFVGLSEVDGAAPESGEVAGLGSESESSAERIALAQVGAAPLLVEEANKAVSLNAEDGEYVSQMPIVCSGRTRDIGDPRASAD